MSQPDAVRDQVKQYYGRVLQTSRDLKTNACCSSQAVPAHVRCVLEQLHPEVVEKFYGCGAPIPPALDGATVLDLGCGSGRDCYLLSSLVGPGGRVIGVDMTGEQLAVAERQRGYHAQAFGYPESNVVFRQGYMEDLAAIGIADDSIDLVVSNCVFNLSPDKARLFAEVFRVLKPGGELYFSDVFADRRVPESLRDDPVMRGECLGGALYREDCRRLLAAAGCADARTVSAAPISLTDPQIARAAGMIDFTSGTVRAFKLALEDRCEDYGQIARYRARSNTARTPSTSMTATAWSPASRWPFAAIPPPCSGTRVTRRTSRSSAIAPRITARSLDRRRRLRARCLRLVRADVQIPELFELIIGARDRLHDMHHDAV